MKKSHGFTLIELMVVIAIVAILVSLAAPSFKSMIQSSNMTSAVNTFLADMRFARSESIRRGGHVMMCRSNLPETTQACNGTTGAGNGWLTGWIVFHDLNNDGTKDAGEPILRVQSAITSMDSIIEPTSPTYKFRFNATGQLPGATATINFGSTDFPSTVQRVVCVSFGGRARIAGDGYSSCN
jgi:type IV fimbrial biogenesis protein FimT